MNISNNPTFQSTRKIVASVDFENLARDLVMCAERNITDYALIHKSYRYHFHIVNGRDIAVTVKLSKYNNISVRGKIVNKLDNLYKVIESIKD